MKRDKEYDKFIMDMLFIAVSSQDHEDAMEEILYLISDEEDEEFELEDIIYAAGFASMYHRPSSLEAESLDYIRILLAERHLNG